MEHIYYDPKHQASYGGVAKLKKYSKDAKEWLATQRAYTLHKPARKHFVTRATRTSHHGSQWQADLNDMIAYSRFNKGYRYILTVIDIFSRMGWALPLKTKTGLEMIKAFTTIFKKTKAPHLLQSDQGKEFENRIFQAFLKQHKVHHFSVKSPYKASLVERWNRTLKMRMFRYFTQQGNYKWLQVLPHLVESYNQASHSSLPKGMTPSEAAKDENHYRVWLNQEKDIKVVKARFKVGDLVRISKVKGTFEKGYLANWSEEVFTIARVDTRYMPIMYVIKDEKGEEIEGKFYNAELQKVSNPKGLYAVEKVIRRKGGRYLVKFLGYPGEHWVDALEKL
jgi:transposase InsO family protein